MQRFLYITILLLSLSIISCKEKKKEVINTPWGTTLGEEDMDENLAQEDSLHGNRINSATSGNTLSLSDIKSNGEMIMLTLSGPETYYDYHGRGMGVHYLMCEKLAEHLGVTLRVDICSDTLDMLNRLHNGEGDIIAVPVSKANAKGFAICGDGWLINKNSNDLLKVIQAWHKPNLLADTKKQEQQLLTSGMVTRHVYPWMLSAEKGQVSTYDPLFKKYASTAGVDWTMLAAQCYQESCFDPKAHSWAGACGLMQIMPSTADHLALPRNRIYEPEPNIAAAARYIRELMNEFKDISNPAERIKFALAAYNGGYFHIRDAMALTKKYGGISQRWSDVKQYVLALMKPAYYNDPIVKYGYMRGQETANYVDMIIERQGQYRHALRTGTVVISKVNIKSNSPSKEPRVGGGSSLLDATPHRAKHKNKWRKDE